MRQLNTLELTERWESQRDIKNLMGKYANCVILNRQSDIYPLFWSQKRDDIRLGLNDGWYIGKDAVCGYYAAQREKNALSAACLQAKFPEQLGGKTADEIYGTGPFRVRPVSCPIIEVGEDGTTAEGLWTCMGAEAEIEATGPSAYWTWGYYLGKFILEDGEWKILELQYLLDLSARCGSDWNIQPAKPIIPEFAPMADFSLPEPTEKVVLRERYSPRRKLTPPPAIPQSTGTPAALGADANDTDKLIRRVWDVEEIKKLVSRRCYYIAADRRADEIAELWVSGAEAQKTASFGRNWGWYVGMDAIGGYYVDSHLARRRENLSALAQADSSVSAGDENLGIGVFDSHPATTGLVRVAEDGKTAKGMWYCISQETKPLPQGGSETRWLMEKLAIDFMREEDGWKIWHLVIADDLNALAGEDYTKQPVYVDWDNDPVKLEFGKPTVELLTHDPTFNWWDDYPFLPMEYDTFTDAISYGPEGHPKNRGRQTWHVPAKGGRNYTGGAKL
jgi:hypothetical protein